ncbi:MAG: hypothetical protein FWH29_10755 [Methanobrevibacter sp.]|nr:hypothetical protein [Methanobrevibacter sp.]
MDKKIIIATVLFVTIAISGCITSSIENIDLTMSEISQNIVDGDRNYNEAVKYVNSRNYDAADEKIKNAITSFNEGQNKFLSIDNVNEINETIYTQYINLIKEEISLKQNATINLQLAIQYYKSGNNETANGYVTKANSFMTQGVVIQNQRHNLAVNNPDKFK